MMSCSYYIDFSTMMSSSYYIDFSTMMSRLFYFVAILLCILSDSVCLEDM